MSHFLQARRVLPLVLWFGAFYWCFFAMLANGAVKNWVLLGVCLLLIVLVLIPLVRAYGRLLNAVWADGHAAGSRDADDDHVASLESRYAEGVRDGRERAVAALLEIHRLDATQIDEGARRFAEDLAAGN